MLSNLGLISNLMHKILVYLHIIHLLTLILLTWRIWRVSNNASRWHMGFNLAFKGLNSSTSFEHYPAHLQEVHVVIVYMQPLVSSLSAGDCLVHRLRKNSSSFLTGAQESHLQRGTIPEAAYIQLRRGPPEDEQGNARNL